ncbi:MAG: hypothetical protein RBG13Loki_2211 [Promethearchaeota archaeon CR_4]|nr:MAG: hypothetical protein RBG13Loki_2211 [Candidatus Lokiarchaeota archaeon CR_4]
MEVHQNFFHLLLLIFPRLNNKIPFIWFIYQGLENLDTVLFYACLLVLGAGIGFLATLGGIGGGVFLVPLYMFFFALDQVTAKGSSVLSIFMAAVLATITHVRNKRVDFKCSFLLGLISIGGSIVSTLVFYAVPVDSRSFLLIFCIFLSLVVVKLFRPIFKEYRAHKNARPREAREPLHSPVGLTTEKSLVCNFQNNILHDWRTLLKAIPLFFMSGFLSYFLGIGGGVINTPVFISVFQFPIHYATAGSTAIIFINSIYNCIAYGMRGQIDYALAVWIGIGMSVGSTLASHYSAKIPKNAITLVLIGLLVFTVVNSTIKIFS